MLHVTCNLGDPNHDSVRVGTSDTTPDSPGRFNIGWTDSPRAVYGTNR